MKVVPHIVLQVKETDELILVSGPNGWNLSRISFGCQLHTEPPLLGLNDVTYPEEVVFTILWSGGQDGSISATVVETVVDGESRVLYSKRNIRAGYVLPVEFIAEVINKEIDSWNRSRRRADEFAKKVGMTLHEGSW
jgi:hypothetical protein